MAENYDENEVALHQLLSEVTGGAWLATPRYYELQSAVLARMAGPGEVVVPVEIDRALPEWQASDSSKSYWAKCLAVLRGPG